MLIFEYVKNSSHACNTGNFVTCFNKDSTRFVLLYVLVPFCPLPQKAIRVFWFWYLVPDLANQSSAPAWGSWCMMSSKHHIRSFCLPVTSAPLQHECPDSLGDFSSTPPSMAACLPQPAAHLQHQGVQGAPASLLPVLHLPSYIIAFLTLCLIKVSPWVT